MKRNWKKVMSLALVLVLCFSMTACKKKTAETKGDATADATVETTETTDTAEESAETVEPLNFDEHMTLSIALWGIGDCITDGDDAVRDIIYDKFNIDIEPYPITWTDFTEKVTLWAASGSMPDMTAYAAGYTKDFDNWTTQGVVRALPSDLSRFPNVEALVTGTDGKSVNKILDTTTDPVYYAVPRPTYSNQDDTMLDYGVMLRKDWMEAVGVTEEPDNLDALIDLCKKFQTEDPDGNGVDDTIGITGYNYSWMTGLLMGSNPAAENGFRWEFAADGSLIPTWATQNGLKGFKAMKKVYDAGVIDPDYIILKGEEGRDKFKNGKAGAYVHSGPGLMAIQFMQQGFAKTMPDKTIDQIITFCPIFANEDGSVTYPKPNTFWSETYLGANVSDEKADRCMALLDYLLSDEGYRLVSLGIEGTDYTIDADGNVTLIETLNDDGTLKTQAQKYPIAGIASLGCWSDYFANESPAYDATIKKMKNDFVAEQLARGAKAADLPDCNGLVITENADYDTVSADYAKIFNDLMTADDIDTAWKEWVDSTMNAGFDKIVVEMNDLYKASGR